VGEIVVMNVVSAHQRRSSTSFFSPLFIRIAASIPGGVLREASWCRIFTRDRLLVSDFRNIALVAGLTSREGPKVSAEPDDGGVRAPQGRSP